jgi:hypothetical protein
MSTQIESDEFASFFEDSGIFRLRNLIGDGGAYLAYPCDLIFRSENKIIVDFHNAWHAKSDLELVIFPDRTFETYYPVLEDNEKEPSRSGARSKALIKALKLTPKTPDGYNFFSELVLNLTHENDSHTTHGHPDKLEVKFCESFEDEWGVLWVDFYGDKTYKITHQDPDLLDTPAKMAAVKRCLDIIQKFDMNSREPKS